MLNKIAMIILQSSFPVQATPVCPSGGILTWDINANVYTCTGGIIDHHWGVWILTVLILLLSAFIIRLFRSTISLHLGRILLQLKATLTIVIAPAPLAITNTTFNGTVGQPISGSLGITGGTAPFTVTVDDPATLPPGVTVDANGPAGTDTTAPGTFNVPVTITDSGA